MIYSRFRGKRVIMSIKKIAMKIIKKMTKLVTDIFVKRKGLVQ